MRILRKEKERQKPMLTKADKIKKKKRSLETCHMLFYQIFLCLVLREA